MQLSEVESTLKVFIYNLSEPIDEAIFQRINDYAEISDMAIAPVSERQKIDLSILIIIKSKKFKLDVCTWNARDPLISLQD